MFHLELPILEKIIRMAVVYAFLIVGFRLAGKRELAQLNPFDLVVFLTVSNAVQNAIIGNDNSVTGGLISAATLLGLNALVVRFLYHHEKVDRLVEGEPVVLVEDGLIKKERLDKEMLTQGELETGAHKQGFRSLDDVDRAILEPGGGLSFVGKQPGPAESRHQELLARLDRLTAELARLKSGA